MVRTFVVTLALVAATVCSAVAEDPDMQKLVQETQLLHREDNLMNLTWWIPSEFWEITLKADSSLTPEQRAGIIQVLDDYLVIAVLEGEFGPLGGLTGTPREELLTKTLVRVRVHTLTPLADADLSADARNFFQMMKPVLANMLGQIGEGMEFILFEGKDAKEQRYADPKVEGSLVVQVGVNEFTFRLPLGSLLAPKYDPATGEEFPGNYVYNPFSGTKLQTTKPVKNDTRGDTRGLDRL